MLGRALIRSLISPTHMLGRAMDFEISVLFFITTVFVVLTQAPAVAPAGQGVSNGAVKSIFGAAGITSVNVVYLMLSVTGFAPVITAPHQDARRDGVPHQQNRRSHRSCM